MADSTLTKIVALIAATETEPGLRQAAVRTAGSVGSAKERALVKALLALLDAPDPTLRIPAIEALGQLKAEEALPALDALARTGGPELEPAVRALAQLGARGVRLMGKAMEQATPAIRARIGDILARSGSGNALVVTAQGLLDPDPHVIDTAARSIATEIPSYTGAQRSALARFLMEALEDKLSSRSQAALLRVLGHLHEPRAEELFWERLDGSAPAEVRAAALQALGSSASPSSDARLQRLLACAAEADFQTVAAALMILRNVPVRPKQLKGWLALLDAPDVATRRFAIEKLRGMEKPEFAKALVPQLAHPDRSLRAEALAALLAFPAGRTALFDQLTETAQVEEAWSLARALASAAVPLSDTQRDQLYDQAAQLQLQDDRRAPALWFLLRESGAEGLRDRLEETAASLRKKKKYSEAMHYYRLLAQDPGCSEETRFDLAATGLKLSRRDLAAEQRGGDPTLHQFGRLLQNPDFDVLGRLKKAKWLEPEELFYLGFHFAEQPRRAREFGRSVLELVVERTPKSEIGKQARRKLKSEALSS